MLAPTIPEDEAKRMAALHSLDLLFTPSEERFDRITRLASKFLGTPISVVSLVADKCQWFKSAQGLNATETPREISFCGHAILGDETFVVENATQDSRFADNPLVTADPNIRSYAGQPLHTEDGHRVGTLCVIDRIPRTFTPEQLEVLRDLAALVETELQRGQLSDTQRLLLRERDELRRKVAIDELTRTWSRAAIMELLDAELARAKRGMPMCVAMVDADHFKKVNDTYGHQAGDVVLVEIAKRIRRAVREFDAVGRYGGEEFMVVLSNCNVEAANRVCERIRGFVAHDPIVTLAGQLSASVSIGLAEGDSEHDYVESIVGAADAALYRAKANGRNRVEVDGASMQSLLIIGDDPEIGALVSAFVKPLGYSCEHATAFEQLKASHAKTPTVIVIDLMMRDGDGIKVLGYLGEQRSRAGILLLGGMSNNLLLAEEIARAKGLRVIGVLSKPFTRSELEGVLRREERVQALDVTRKPTNPMITEDELQRAIVEKQFVLYYQPRIDIKTGAATGVEVLLRWKHPVHGLLLPDKFVSQAESWKLIDGLTWAVTDSAFYHAKMFSARCWNPTLVFSASTSFLRNDKLPDMLWARAKAAEILPARIIVEITGSAVINVDAAVLDTLAQLKSKGFGLSVDAFGLGFAVLPQLEHIPANEIKIDKKFVRMMHRDPGASMIAHKTIDFGHGLSMKVVATGVDTRQQLKILRELNCDLAQGYLFSPPMLVEDFIAWHETPEWWNASV